MNSNQSAAVGSSTDVGRIRDHNEDSLLVQPPLFVVADGMGGHAAGEVASRLAVESFADSKLSDTSDEEAIKQAIEQANRRVVEAATGAAVGMGTTCAVLLIGDGVGHVANVGDSRVYLLRDKELRQLSRDHTLVAEMVDQGLISAAQTLGGDGTSQITRALGGGEMVRPDASTLPLESGDRFLLCSDGLSSMVNDDAIRTILLAGSEPQPTADRLVAAANEAGGEDNVTAIVVDISFAATPAPSRWRKALGGLTTLALTWVTA